MAYAFANEKPASRDPIRPGPWVTATASSSFKEMPDSKIAFSTTGTIASMCFLEASSGTTPPYGWCKAIWDDITDDKTFVPSITTDAAVSSQDVSMPRIFKCLK